MAELGVRLRPSKVPRRIESDYRSKEQSRSGIEDPTFWHQPPRTRPAPAPSPGEDRFPAAGTGIRYASRDCSRQPADHLLLFRSSSLLPLRPPTGLVRSTIPIKALLFFSPLFCFSFPFIDDTSRASDA
jgi:hypothetical protein